MTTAPRRVVPAILAAALAVLAVGTAVLLVGRPDQGSGPELGAVLDASDRQVIGARREEAGPLRRGAPAPPADPAVDLTDPAAVVRAYLSAARSTDPDDAGATRLRAAAYAVPGSPPAAVGVVVLDPPPPGRVCRATVTGLDLVDQDDADLRRGYRATVTSATGRPDAAPSATSTEIAYVVLARQIDGRWLVAQDLPGDAEAEADD